MALRDWSLCSPARSAINRTEILHREHLVRNLRWLRVLKECLLILLRNLSSLNISCLLSKFKNYSPPLSIHGGLVPGLPPTDSKSHGRSSPLHRGAQKRAHAAPHTSRLPSRCWVRGCTDHGLRVLAVFLNKKVLCWHMCVTQSCGCFWTYKNKMNLSILLRILCGPKGNEIDFCAISI